MSLYQDIDNAIVVIKGNTKIRNHYDKVQLFPDYSLKHFKKYNLDGKNVLTNVNNIEGVFDLLSYNAKVTCFSSNRLNKYFIDLLFKLHYSDRKKYFNFILNDEGLDKSFSNKVYENIKDKLNEETIIFFDELYNFCKRKNIPISSIIKPQNYSKDVIERFVRSLLNNRYYEVRDNNNLSIWDASLNEAYNIFKPNTFDFINLSMNIENVDDEKLKRLYILEEKYYQLLKSNCKLQAFESREKINIPNHKIIETRSILDPNSKQEVCKKDYAYVYSK